MWSDRGDRRLNVCVKGPMPQSHCKSLVTPRGALVCVCVYYSTPGQHVDAAWYRAATSRYQCSLGHQQAHSWACQADLVQRAWVNRPALEAIHISFHAAHHEKHESFFLLSSHKSPHNVVERFERSIEYVGSSVLYKQNRYRLHTVHCTVPPIHYWRLSPLSRRLGWSQICVCFSQLSLAGVFLDQKGV